MAIYNRSIRGKNESIYAQVTYLTLFTSSKDGVFDKRCIDLARLCNEAVDYPRNGQRVDSAAMPKRLFNRDPDWRKREGESDESKFYPSQRAIGE